MMFTILITSIIRFSTISICALISSNDLYIKRINEVTC